MLTSRAKDCLERSEGVHSHLFARLVKGQMRTRQVSNALFILLPIDLIDLNLRNIALWNNHNSKSRYFNEKLFTFLTFTEWIVHLKLN